jgi:hypothetical protein
MQAFHDETAGGGVVIAVLTDDLRRDFEGGCEGVTHAAGSSVYSWENFQGTSSGVLPYIDAREIR